MTSGVCGSGKAVGGHSTNWAKLNRKTALSWYSGEAGVCAGEAAPRASSRTAMTNPTTGEPLPTRFARRWAKVLRARIKNRPVRGPRLQGFRTSAVSRGPRALTRRPPAILIHPLRSAIVPFHTRRAQYPGAQPWGRFGRRIQGDDGARDFDRRWKIP